MSGRREISFLPAQLETHDPMIVATALLPAQSGQTAQLVTRDEAVTAANLVPAAP